MKLTEEGLVLHGAAPHLRPTSRPSSSRPRRPARGSSGAETHTRSMSKIPTMSAAAYHERMAPGFEHDLVPKTQKSARVKFSLGPSSPDSTQVGFPISSLPVPPCKEHIHLKRFAGMWVYECGLKGDRRKPCSLAERKHLDVRDASVV